MTRQDDISDKLLIRLEFQRFKFYLSDLKVYSVNRKHVVSLMVKFIHQRLNAIIINYTVYCMLTWTVLIIEVACLTSQTPHRHIFPKIHTYNEKPTLKTCTEEFSISVIVPPTGNRNLLFSMMSLFYQVNQTHLKFAEIKSLDSDDTQK